MGFKNLKEKAQAMTATLPIMEGREKGNTDDLLGDVLTIRDYDYLNGDGHDYAVFITDEYPKVFFFGGSVLTQNLKELDDEGYHEDVVKEGLPVKFDKKKSKANREYTNVTFFPEA